MIDSMDERDIPAGRLARFGRLAALGARAGASLLASKDGAGAAEYAAEVLGNMRGLAAKVGQMASYVDGVVPEAHRASYEASLGKLRAAAPTSSFAAVKRTVEEELGKPLGDLFATFDEIPIASASIGQVHRASLADGREVAVKVQHAGIATAVESDLANAGLLEAVARAGGAGKLNSKGVLAKVRERFREELDYVLEAERQEKFRAFHAGDPTIRIPAVIADRSTRRVLTTELAKGVSLEEAATRDEAERRAFAETLWRFVFRGNLVLGMFNADPHPGNYLFGEHGVVTFLDFGCVEPLAGKRHAAARRMHAAAIHKDEPTFVAGVRDLVETKPGTYEDFVVAYSRRCFAPLFDSPFRMTRPYAAGLVATVGDMKKAMFKRGSNFTPIPEGMVFINRLQFGFYSVLARLDVEVDYRTVEIEFLTRAGLL
jgi:predicted unusual protein kinase regulating ubiquinone biosynthesis (AarF/ABC1/UbiB family)